MATLTQHADGKPVYTEEPNKVTIAAMKEAESGMDAGRVDVSILDRFMESME